MCRDRTGAAGQSAVLHRHRARDLPGVGAADPYPWPFDGELRPDNTALIVIDMQTDFCGIGGYVDRMGYDISLTRAPIEPISPCWRHARKPRLCWSSTPAKATARPVRPAGQQALALAAHRRRHRRSRGRAAHPGARRAGLGNHPELAPLPGEPIIDKPGKGSFCATDLELLLHKAGIRNLVLTGITTDVCVHTTMRDANDMGFECLLLEDCCGATDPGNHLAARHGEDAGRRVRRGGHQSAPDLEALP
jgi:biuret amidohydrolase